MDNGTIKNFFVPENDLAILEKCIPMLHEIVSMVPGAYMRPDVLVAIEESKRILSDIRWGYGPFQEITIIPTKDETP